MRWLVGTSVRLRLFALVAAAGVVVLGVLQAPRTAVDVLPEFSPPTVEVQTEALGLSAEEVEQLITVPLEQNLFVGVPFLAEMNSVSMPGVSSIVMTFEEGTDLLEARQVVQERLTQVPGVAGLPVAAKMPQMVQPLSSTGRVAIVRLSSQRLTPIDVSVLARWVIGPKLMSVPGVANVVVWGNRDRQLQVRVDPQRLADVGATLAQVISTTGNALEVSPVSFLQASTPGTGGFIDTPNQRLNIFHEQTISTPRELAQVPLEDQVTPAGVVRGRGLSLGDVTDVVEAHQPLVGDAVCSGGQQCILLVVQKFPEANTVEVTRGVEQALAALRPGLADMRMDTSVYRPATYVESSFSNLARALLVGAVLLLLLLALSLRSWRTLIVAVTAIAASGATAVLVLHARDVTVDLVMVAGLVVALSAVVHDCVNDVDRIAAALRGRHGVAPDRASAGRTVVEASAEARRSVACAILVVAAAALPAFFVDGASGAFLPGIAVSYLLAVGASMLVALTVTPALAVSVLASSSHRHLRPSLRTGVRRTYERLSRWLAARNAVALVAGAALALTSVVSVLLLDVSLRPALRERHVLVQVEAAPGTSLPRMTALTRGLMGRIEALPGVSGAGSHVGRALMADEVVNVNSGEIWAALDVDADHDATVASIQDAVDGQAEISARVSSYAQDRISSLLARPRDDVVVRLYGEDPAVLDRKAGQVRDLLGAVDGVASAKVARMPREPNLQIEVDLPRAQAFGVKPGDVRRAAASLIGSITVGHLFDEQKVFDVVVWGHPDIRRQVRDIQRLLIDTPTGTRVRLSRVAEVRVVQNPTEIRHEGASSYLDVTADVAARDVDAVVEEADAALRAVTFPLEHHAEVLATPAADASQRWTLLAAAAGSLVAIVLLLQAAFESWRLAAVASAALLMSLSGGLLAAVLVDGLTLGAVAGLLAVLGLAAREIVVLGRRYRAIEWSAPGTDAAGVALQAGGETVRPVLLTALATALVLAPIAASPGVTGFDVVQPATVVVLGGVLTTTLVVLVVLPALYGRYGYGTGHRRWVDDPQRAGANGRPRPAATPTGSGVLRRVRTVLAAPMALLAVTGLSGCAGAVGDDAYVVDREPSRLVHLGAGHRTAVVLTERARQRLRIQTTVVGRTVRGPVVPSSAVFVDTHGIWWVYTNPRPRTYVREQVRLVRDVDGRAQLAGGPSPGTAVVTVGVQELYGVEDDVGH